jgi:hypothetical protein
MRVFLSVTIISITCLILWQILYTPSFETSRKIVIKGNAFLYNAGETVPAYWYHLSSEQDIKVKFLVDCAYYEGRLFHINASDIGKAIINVDTLNGSPMKNTTFGLLDGIVLDSTITWEEFKRQNSLQIGGTTNNG